MIFVLYLSTDRTVNPVRAFNTAVATGKFGVARVVEDYIILNFASVTQLDEIVELSLELLLEILDSNEFWVPSEEVVFNLVSRWLFDPKTKDARKPFVYRVGSIDHLVKHLQIPKITHTIIV